MDNAIAHAEEVIKAKDGEVTALDNLLGIYYDANGVRNFERCAEKHRQLVEWLRDYKRLKEQERTGHWILKIEDWNKWMCSKCGHTERTDIHVSLGYDFCPKCGAKMGWIER